MKNATPEVLPIIGDRVRRRAFSYLLDGIRREVPAVEGDVVSVRTYPISPRRGFVPADVVIKVDGERHLYHSTSADVVVIWRPTPENLRPFEYRDETYRLVAWQIDDETGARSIFDIYEMDSRGVDEKTFLKVARRVSNAWNPEDNGLSFTLETGPFVERLSSNPLFGGAR
jgi:hypothetical protein